MRRMVVVFLALMVFVIVVPFNLLIFAQDIPTSFPEFPTVSHITCGENGTYFTIDFDKRSLLHFPDNERIAPFYYFSAVDIRVEGNGATIKGVFPIPTEPSATELDADDVMKLALFKGDDTLISEAQIVLTENLAGQFYDQLLAHSTEDQLITRIYMSGAEQQSFLVWVTHNGDTVAHVESIWKQEGEFGLPPSYDGLFVGGTEIVTLCDRSQSTDTATRLADETIPDRGKQYRGYVATSNADWTPIEQDFDGATMVLVPAGCFMMGSEVGADDEQPVHEQCIENPFWIDKYEVTNEQFGGVSDTLSCASVSSELDQPHNCVDWLEAKTFCEGRNARLPSEREWEYASRGPDNVTYPWGDDLVEENATFLNNANGQTAPVGSRPQGVSWVGAMDMSGNVWEWVQTLALPYPYSDATANDDVTLSERVMRGGSFINDEDALRSSERWGVLPHLKNNFVGFRCARVVDE